MVKRTSAWIGKVDSSSKHVSSPSERSDVYDAGIEAALDGISMVGSYPNPAEGYPSALQLIL